MRGIKQKLSEVLLEDDAAERCGFISKKGDVIEVTNIAADPTEQFKIDPGLVVKYVDQGVVATWHTHYKGDPNLSGEDMACFLSWPSLDHYVVGRRDGEVHVVKYGVKNGFVLQS